MDVRGLDREKDPVDGVVIGGLPDFAALLGEVDRLVAL